MHPEFTFLPRKFKIAITAAAHDRAAVRVHDIGLRLHRNMPARPASRSIVGGGLGRTPFIGKTIKPFLPKRDLLSYVEAILRIYNQYGRRDNIHKARIKILVHQLGAEKFAAEVEDEWHAIKDGALAVDPARVADIARALRLSAISSRCRTTPRNWRRRGPIVPAFDAWFSNAVARHKVPGYAIVTLSLKPQGGPPGDATSAQMDAIADSGRSIFVSARSGSGTSRTLCCRMSHSVTCRRCGRRSTGLASPRRMSGSCPTSLPVPGLDYCTLANARSIPIAQELTRRFRNHRGAARHRPPAHQYFRLHQCLRPSSRWPYRHPRGREERRGILPDHARRTLRQACTNSARCSARRCRMGRSPM